MQQIPLGIEVTEDLGNGWIVHSSGRGVTLDPLTGWYKTELAWGRRPLAEAGLE